MDEDKAIRCIRARGLCAKGVLLFDAHDTSRAQQFKVRFRLNGLEPTVLQVYPASESKHFMQVTSECLETHFAAKLLERQSYVFCLASASDIVRRLAKFLSAVYVRGIWLVVLDGRNRVRMQNQAKLWIDGKRPCPGKLDTLGSLRFIEI